MATKGALWVAVAEMIAAREASISVLTRANGRCMFRPNRFHQITGLYLVVFLFLAASSWGQEKPKFPISVASKTVGFVPVWVAWKLGYFEREGLAVDLC